MLHGSEISARCVTMLVRQRFTDAFRGRSGQRRLQVFDSGGFNLGGSISGFHFGECLGCALYLFDGDPQVLATSTFSRRHQFGQLVHQPIGCEVGDVVNDSEQAGFELGPRRIITGFTLLTDILPVPSLLDVIGKQVQNGFYEPAQPLLFGSRVCTAKNFLREPVQ
jgi:hypothetical protein